jgi:TfoX/Sxy family transcriptional regulator of competence genes
MAYDEFLADRVRQSLAFQHIFFEEKKMMGGLTFMVKDKMCVGIHSEKLMARIDPEIYEMALMKKGCRKMEFTGREMKGFVFIDPEGIDKEKDLNYWIDLALVFNEKAKSSKKKK